MYNSKAGILVRQHLGFRAPLFTHNFESSYLASDLFLWITKDGFSTIFRASNILEKYYGISSTLLICFFDKYGNSIGLKEFSFSNGMVEVLIDSELVNNDDYGTFCVFNRPNDKTPVEVNVTNRCYIGYGKSDDFSMVHGNLIAIKAPVSQSPELLLSSLKPAVSNFKRSTRYAIQKSFDPETHASLLFSNPLERPINIGIDEKWYKVPPMGCVVHDVKEVSDDEAVTVTSDFIMPRPTVICFKDGFIDCHHA